MSKVRQKQQQRRSAIIEAVIPLIGAVPFDELSVQEICETAGISVGSFYHYFEKKSDLLIGLLGLIDEHLEAEVYRKLTDADDVENLHHFAREWALYVEAHGLERSKLISSVVPANTDMSGQKRSSVAFLEALIARGQEKGQITRAYGAGELTEFFLLALRGITTDWSRNNGRYDLEEKMDAFIGLWLKALRSS